MVNTVLYIIYKHFVIINVFISSKPFMALTFLFERQESPAPTITTCILSLFCSSSSLVLLTNNDAPSRFRQKKTYTLHTAFTNYQTLFRILKLISLFF